MSKQPDIKRIIVLGEFEDGKIRQFLIKDNECKTTNAIMWAIAGIEGRLNVSEDPIDGLEIIKKEE